MDAWKSHPTHLSFCRWFPDDTAKKEKKIEIERNVPFLFFPPTVHFLSPSQQYNQRQHNLPLKVLHVGNMICSFLLHMITKENVVKNALF